MFSEQRRVCFNIDKTLILKKIRQHGVPLGACLKPYKDFSNLQRSQDVWNRHRGGFMNTVSSNMPCKKELETSDWLRGQWFVTAKAKNIRKVGYVITRLKASVKYIPTSCWLPLATNLALYLEMVPFECHLILKIRWQLIRLAWEGHETNSQVRWWTKASNSYCMAVFHTGCLRASM